MPKNAEKKPPFIFGINGENKMQKSGIVTKINMPNAIVQLCAVVLVGIGVTSTALGAGFRDGGTSSVYTCRAPNMGTPTGWDQTDWSVPVSGFTGQSDLASDDPIPNCKTTTTVSYYSDRAGFYVGAHKRNTCSACNTGYHLVSHTMPSTSAQDCIVTWEECVKDTPCDGLVCEGMSSWGSYSGTSSTHNQTRCNSSTNKCEYRCVNGYYDKGGAIVVGNPTKRCAACPPNATCSNVANPDISCHVGYYLVSEGSAISGYTKTCPACPTLGLNNVTGISRPGSTSITRCYIPPLVNIKDTTGEYQFTTECYYTTE